MLSTLSITAPAPGMLRLNGRFAGEVGELPLVLPVAARGALYLEYTPLDDGWQPMARRLVLSGGKPLQLPEGMFGLLWADGLIELELSPRRNPTAEVCSLSLAGVPCRFCTGEENRLEFGALTLNLPERAEPPEAFRTEQGLILLGDWDGGQYALTLSPDLARQTGSLHADQIERESDLVLRAVDDRRDIAGRAELRRWQVSERGLQPLSSEEIWLDGAPRTPTTPEETARFVAEALLLNHPGEAEPFLAPPLLGQLPSLSGFEDCIPMRSGVDGVGLLRRESDHLASVAPLHYRAEPFSGSWRLTELRLGSESSDAY